MNPWFGWALLTLRWTLKTLPTLNWTRSLQGEPLVWFSFPHSKVNPKDTSHSKVNLFTPRWTLGLIEPSHSKVNPTDKQASQKGPQKTTEKPQAQNHPITIYIYMDYQWLIWIINGYSWKTMVTMDDRWLFMVNGNNNGNNFNWGAGQGLLLSTTHLDSNNCINWDMGPLELWSYRPQLLWFCTRHGAI